ncbi:unnamed protein product [Calypogeia fissa]
MAAVVRAVISTPSFCSTSDPQSSSVSVSSASCSPLQHLIRLPRKCSPRLRPDSGLLSLKFSKIQAHSRHSSSPSLVFTLSSLKKSAIVDEEAVVEPVSNPLLRNLGVFSAGSFVLGTAGAVLAETIDVTTPPPSTSDGAATDYLLSFLFIGAFIGLSVVTIGVIYLGVTDFLENRERVAMQKAAGEEKFEKTEKSDAVRVGSGKGFGVKKTEKKTEKDE